MSDLNLDKKEEIYITHKGHRYVAFVKEIRVVYTAGRKEPYVEFDVAGYGVREND